MTRPHRTPAAQNGILGPDNPKSVTSRSVTWRYSICLLYSQRKSPFASDFGSLGNRASWCLINLRVPQKEVGKRSSITFFRFRGSFGHFLVTFSDASVTFSSLFCKTPFAGLLLRHGENRAILRGSGQNRRCNRTLRAQRVKTFKISVRD